MTRVLQNDQLIGDLLMITPTIRALKEQYPDDRLVYHFPITDTGAHVSGTHVLLEGNDHLDAVLIGDAYTPAEGDVVLPLDSMKAFQWAARNGRTLVEGFGHLAGVETDGLHYDYWLDAEELARADETIKKLGQGRPLVICARHSASCTSNAPAINIPNKCLPNHIWVEVARWLSQQGFTPVAVGSARDAKDVRYRHWWGEKLYGEPIRDVAAVIARAHAVISIDTGIRHLAAAVGTNLFTVSGAIPLSRIRCESRHDRHRVFEELRPVGLVTLQSMIDGASKVL